jgi:6-phosphogluconolactonase
MDPQKRAVAASLALAPLACAHVDVQAPGAVDPRPARHVLVSTHDGHVHVLALDEGRLGAAAADMALGEPIRFLAAHPMLPVVYALGDTRLFALTWDEGTGALTPLGDGAVGGRGTHVTVHPSGRCALVASYGEHSVRAIPLEPDGRPRDVAHVLGGDESGRLRRAHQVRVHAGTGVVHVPCLGEDHVAVLEVDTDTCALTWLGAAATPGGAGPRHMDYAPQQPFAYVLNEVASSVTQLAVDVATGALTPVATFTTLPQGFTESTGRSSDVHVSPDGRFLFAVNREPLNDIVTFAIAGDGSLSEVARAATGGVHARTFALDPTGRFLWIGNTRSRNVTAFAVGTDGVLRPLQGSFEAPADVSCVLVAGAR